MRAGEVIRGLRALAKKSGPQLTKLDIDDVIGKVLVVARGELLRTMSCCAPNWLWKTGR
jgi:hypothetical protein